MNTPGFEGDTPLHDAVINNHVEVHNLVTQCRVHINSGYIMYEINTENGGLTPDKSRGPQAPRDLSGVKPTFEFVEFIISIVFLRFMEIHPAKEQKKPTQLLNKK